MMYLTTHMIRKQHETKLKVITLLQKEWGEGGGPERYNHDHRFNVFLCLPLSVGKIRY